MSTDKFLSTGGSGVTDLGNGSATIFASTLGAKNLDPSRPVKTNAVSQLVSDNLEISDINNLQSELDAGVSNPLTSSLNFSNFSSVNKTSDEFIKKSTGSTGNATAGSIKIYANTDGQLHSVDESGTDKIIGNSGHVLGPNSVGADGKVAIYNGTTGKVLKDSNLVVDAQNHFDISGNFARYQGGVDYLNPTDINSLAAVGYVRQERDASNGRITTLETNTTNISYDGANTLLENIEVYIGNALYTGLNTLDSTTNGGYVIHNQCSEFSISGWGGNGITDISYKSNYPTGADVGYLISSVDIKSQDNTGSTSIGSQTRCFASELWTPTAKGTKYEINTIPNGSMILGNRLKIDGDNITTLTAGTININTSTGTKLSVGEFKTVIRGQLDIARQNDPSLKIIHEGSTSISDTAGHILCEGGAGSGGESWFLGTFGNGSNLLKLESKAPNTNLELITANVNRVRLKADGTFEILDGNLVLSEQLEQRTNGVAIQFYTNIKSGGVLDGEEIYKRKIGAYDNTNTLAPVINEVVTASGDITTTNHGTNYEIKTTTTGSTVKTTRLKIGANGDTEIYGDIRLFGNVRVGSAGFLELNFGSPTSTYRFPQYRPQAGDVLTGGLGDGSLAWANPGLYSGISDGIAITGSTEQSLLPTSGVGSLTVAANTFRVGDTFHLVCAGDILVGDNVDTITVRLKQNGTILGQLTIKMEDTIDPVFFELEVDFTIRSIGATGQVITNFDFTFNKNLIKDFRGSRHVKLSTLDTTTSSTLALTAQFSAGALSEIQTRLFYLRKQY